MRCLFCFLFCLVVPVVALAERQRVFVLSDISNEPDDEESLVRFLVYPEAGTFNRDVTLSAASGHTTSFTVPTPDAKTPKAATIHIILQVQDNGQPSLTSYRRAVVRQSLKP